MTTRGRRTFPVCDLEASFEAQEAVFGPVADWLLENILSDRESRDDMADRFGRGYGRAGFCQGSDNCPVTLLADGSGTHSDAHFVVLELMRTLWVASHAQWIPDSRAHFDISADESDHGPLESVFAVFPGVFRASKIPLPLPKSRTVHVELEERESDNARSVAPYLESIFLDSGRPNYIEEDRPVCLLDVKFFEYYLRRHLQLCFGDDTFCESELQDVTRSMHAFEGCATIFAHDDVENRAELHAMDEMLFHAGFLDGSEMLQQYPPDHEPYYEWKSFRGWT